MNPDGGDIRLDDLRLRTDANATDAAGKRGRLRRIFSPLTLRILAVNLTAPVLLVLGLLFLDQYEDTLIAAELDALRTQGELMAASIGEGAVIISENDAIPLFTPEGAMRVIDPDPARQLLRRQGTIARLRAQLFDRDGKLLADSRLLQGPGGEVQVQDLPPMESSRFLRFVHAVYDKTIGRLTVDRTLEPYNDQMRANGPDIKEVMNALQAGEAGNSVRLRSDGQKILSVAVPVQFYKQIVGALLVSRDGSNVDKRMFAVRGSILGMFAWVLALTVLTSLFLAGTIARPVRRLATSAKRVRDSKNRQHTIPDLSKRNDEIGELSEALRDMTESLWRRMDATEHFAADVAHEIKNPLTSLRSAVETVGRVKDPEQQKRLMSIIMDDVARLDRLISEISDASRLDAEMSRAEMSSVKIKPLVQALSEVQNANDNPDAPRAQVVEDPAQKGDLTVFGLESRIGQVFRNLIGNASSFSPPKGVISIRAGRQGRYVIVTVEDQGPGIPAGKEAAIFGRFYSERPEGEKFGTHSGLGLSISKTIVEGHRGQIYAENIIGEDGSVKGARFVVLLPAAN
ncbi:MAG: sensor histidine kinase [Proteobacteria bacterium]|nr:sensor histidine kinase [Pseudomonadota bacterium]